MKERELADLFEESATRNNEDNNIIVNDDGNVNINKKGRKVKNKTNEDILELLKTNNDKKVVGFHLDKDVRDAFQKVLGKMPPRGAQSKLANKIFRDFFEERDLL
ncbi:hypothetical protein Q8G37_26440 [Bacillus wiedmannii]|uniref:hypothetical protein n=1 Tax=Bacillus wiedmannii TaxID=1890302 RepID=UPI00272FD71A|nr:hypothetical protein [Bacillus wiedmannii]MDP1459920.1 hypothetical protein [Bacillus wiedmannii]